MMSPQAKWEYMKMICERYHQIAARAGKMLEEAKLDAGKLARILKKHGLEAKFKALGGPP